LLIDIFTIGVGSDIVWKEVKNVLESIQTFIGIEVEIASYKTIKGYRIFFFCFLRNGHQWQQKEQEPNQFGHINLFVSQLSRKIKLQYFN